MAAELLTVSQLWRFHFDEDYLREVGYPDKTLSWSTMNDSPAVWVFIFLIVTGLVNCLPVKQYGELEYIFGVIKITFISGLIFFNVIISALQPVPHDSHFWTWNSPFGFSSKGMILYVDSNDQPTKMIGGDSGRFVALWTAITTIIFSLIGFEAIAISAPENKDLEKYETVKIATKKLVIRLTVLYTLATFAGGLNVPMDDPYLAQANWSSIHGGQNSLFILAAVRNRLRGWPHFFNGMFIFSATTSGINSLYNASRLLHALAGIPEAWPLWAQSWRRRLERTTSRGVPLGTVSVSWLIGLLAFLSVRTDSSQVGKHRHAVN
jgi:amino acid permease